MRQIAHRGISAQAPENTLPAFEMVQGMGIGAIETDLDLSADGVLYLIHDDTLDRTTNTTGLFSDKTSAELDGLDAGSWFAKDFAGTQLLRATDLVPLINTNRWWVNFELKLSNLDAQALYLSQIGLLLDQLTSDSDVLVSSFNVPLLAAFKKQFPHVKTALLWEGILPDNWETVIADVQASAIHPELGFINEDWVNRFHAADLSVNVWTVNEMADQQQLEKWEVDGIFTDFPR